MTHSKLESGSVNQPLTTILKFDSRSRPGAVLVRDTANHRNLLVAIVKKSKGPGTGQWCTIYFGDRTADACQKVNDIPLGTYKQVKQAVIDIFTVKA